MWLGLITTFPGRAAFEQGEIMTKPHPEWEGDICIYFSLLRSSSQDVVTSSSIMATSWKWHKYNHTTAPHWLY